jgi:hypothetical protein
LQAYIVEKSGEVFPVSINLPKFKSNEAFIIVDDNNKKLWIWKGKETPTRLKFASARAAQQLRFEFGLVYRISSLDQGEEPEKFLKLFDPEKEQETSKVPMFTKKPVIVKLATIGVENRKQDYISKSRLEYHGKIKEMVLGLAEKKRVEFLKGEIEGLRSFIASLDIETGTIEKTPDEKPYPLQVSVNTVTEARATLNEKRMKKEAIMAVIAIFEPVKSRKGKLKAEESLIIKLKEIIGETHKVLVSSGEAKDNVNSAIQLLISQGYLSSTNKYYSKTKRWNKTDIIKTIL